MYLRNMKIKISIYSHFFVVFPEEMEVKRLIYRFAENLIEYEKKWDPVRRKNIQIISKIWGGVVRGGNQYRYPISMLNSFKILAISQGFPKDCFQETIVPMYEPAPAEFNLKEEYVPYDYQEEALSFIFSEINNKSPTVLIEMPTGTGKTLTMMAFASRYGKRMGMIVGPSFMEKWVSDFEMYLGVPAEKVYQISGAKAIQRLFRLCEEDSFDYDIVLISLATMQEFYKSYEDNPEDCEALYFGTPFDLWQACKIGFLGGDEMHERLYGVFWTHTFLHTPFHLALSATMLHKQDFITHKQNVIYPKVKRFDKIKPKKFTTLVNCRYRFENFEKGHIATSFPRRTTYSQAAFEYSIRKCRTAKLNLFTMVTKLVDEFYMSRKKNGERCLVYFARTDLADDILNNLKIVFPDLDIRRFIGDDKLEEIMCAELSVTNTQKAGTGLDVPKLITVINFVNLDTQQRNIQILGRLREPKPGESERIFVQCYCMDIKKHLDYKKDRDILFAERTKGRIETSYGTKL